MTGPEATKLRLQLLANGYTPIPNRDKVCKLPGWQKVVVTPDVVRSWRRSVHRATGLRVEDDLTIVDFDVAKDRDNFKAGWLELAHTIAPDFMVEAPLRLSTGDKAAWYGRTGQPFGAVRSHLWVAPGFDPEDASAPRFRLEVFSKGDGGRQFGSFGPHKVDPGGALVSSYSWPGRSPADTPRAELPELSAKQACALCDAFDQLAEAYGLTRAGKATRPGDETVFWTLTPDTMLDTERHGRINVIDAAQLADPIGAGEYFRCSGSFHDPARHNLTSHAISLHPRLGLQVYDFADGAFYRLEARKPPPPVDLSGLRNIAPHVAPDNRSTTADNDRQTDDRGEQTGDLPGSPPSKPGHDATFAQKLHWLLETHAYHPSDDAVVRLYEASEDCRLRPLAFERSYRAWHEQEVGPRGGTKMIYAPKVWESRPEKRLLAGVRLQPDREFPVYEEGGELFKNIYRRPRHSATGGDLAPFLAFLERFLPDPVEREWLLDWMAHKQAKPAVPGTAVIFVADHEDEIDEGVFGTGRGLLFRVVHELYGPAYAKPQDFNVVDGGSDQSRFTSWLHGTVLATIDESRSSKTNYRRGERSATYEVLKNIVDPAPKRRDFKVKYGSSFTGWSYCSIWLATNHADALAIPATDRRFSVLRNGRKMTPAEGRAFAAWITPANVAALSQALARRDLAGFDMFAPLETRSKADMAERAISPVEDILREFMDDPEKGLVFTRPHLEQAVEAVIGSGAHWRGEFAAAWGAFTARPKTDGGVQQRRIRYGHSRHRVFCFKGARGRAEALNDAALLREAMKWIGGAFRAVPVPTAVPDKKDE